MSRGESTLKKFYNYEHDFSVFDSIANIVIAVNHVGRITVFNSACEEAFNYKAEKALGRLVTEIVPFTGLLKVLKTGKSHINRKFVLGNKVYIANRTPIVQDGAIIGAVGIAQDITQLQKLIEEKQGDFHGNNRYNYIRYNLDCFQGKSKKTGDLKKIVKRVAQGPSTVLITGESGTGKEIIAHALHSESKRAEGPFIKVNCAAIPENLLEAELFGYREGAFTGAKKGGQVGKFEQAHKGTIFLDEIGDMPLSMQSKMLRVLQEKEVERLGDAKIRPVDVRVVTATNQDIEELVRQGKFREDLYYRLNVINLHTPPLREKLEDLPGLVYYFINKYNELFNSEIKELSSDTWTLFKSYHWPGNVRELENILESAFNLAEGNYIQVVHLPAKIRNIEKDNGLSIEETNNLPAIIEQVEKETLLRALKNNNGNKAKTAQELGISRAWLYKKIKQYNVSLS